MPVDNKGREKDPAANLLRRALASSASTAEPCPDPEILAAYADRALDADETARYELHFSQCARCREQLAAMSRAAAPVAGERVPRLSWIWDWRLLALAPVTAALIIAAVFFARRPAANRAAEQRPLLAMQAPQQPPHASSAAPLDSAQVPKELPPTPPKPAPTTDASRAHSENGSVGAGIAPAAPASAKVENDRETALRAYEEEGKSRASGSDFASGVRNDVQLDKPTKKAPAESATTESSTTNSYSVVARSKDGTVIVSGTAVPARSNPPTPPEIADSSVPGPLSHGDAGALSAAAPAKQARVFAESAANSLSVNETVTVEAAADRDVRTIVRSPDPRILWRISSGRFVERSNDAGASWRAQWSNVNARVVAGSAPSVETCWLVGRDGIVLLTTDGKKWRTLEPPANADFVEVRASNAVSATVTSTDGRKFETSDGGKHWAPAP